MNERRAQHEWIVDPRPPSATYALSNLAHHHLQQFLETLFDVKRAKEKKVAAGIAPVPIPEAHARVLGLLHEQTKEMVSSTAYNWIRPSLWTAIFGGKQGLLNNNNGNAATTAAAPAAVAGH